MVVIWSAEAVTSQWVRSEANRAREDGKLVQLSIDGTRLPMPFDQVQCADLTGWSGQSDVPGWRKVLASLADLLGSPAQPTPVVVPPPALPTKPSIVVMPFANLSGDSEQDYFADGMLVEIVEALSRCRSIFVIASGSSLSFKGQGVTAKDAARHLGVRYVLEGSVRRAGDRVRIGVQLIDAVEGSPIWTHRFEDTLEDVFDLQDKVALAVAGRIEPTLEQAEIVRAISRPTDNMGSHDLYLRAWPAFRTYGREGTFQALDLLNKAIAVDPAHGPAMALAASCHRTIIARGWSGDLEDHRRQGSVLAHRAIKAAPEDAAVLASVANDLTILERDLSVALPLAERAIALNPGSASVWFNCCAVKLMAGDHRDARNCILTAMRLDPASPTRLAHLLLLGLAQFFDRNFDEAIVLAKERNRHSASPGGYAILVASHSHLGQIQEAQAALALYATLSQTSLRTFAEIILDPVQRQLMLDGLALAEAGGPPTAG